MLYGFGHAQSFLQTKINTWKDNFLVTKTKTLRLRYNTS